MAKKSSQNTPTTSKVGPQAGMPSTPDQADLLKFCMASIKLWANTTQTAREKFKRDFDLAEGNGKQWLPADRAKVLKQRRPALEFNQTLPQVELICGIQRGIDAQYVAQPRGVEDKRLGEITSAALRATRDFTRLGRKNGHVFDDGTICGLGVWKILHSMYDSQDTLWGDIEVSRVNPMAYIWDPWASADEGFQDGAFMGDASWMHLDEFKRLHPTMTHLGNPGEWLNQAGQFVGDSQFLGMGDNLRRELYDVETGMIRLLTLWRKVPTTVNLVVNTETGHAQECGTKDQGLERLAKMAATVGEEATKPFQVIQAGETTQLIDQRTGQAQQFASPEMAQQRLAQLSEAQGMGVYDTMKILTREARVPHWVEMVWGQILEEGKTPYRDKLYPYVPYVSRMLQDDPESIMGVVRNLWDPQDEFNKRYSNLLAHSNSSSHSGWINRKAGGANSTALEQLGSAPGIVVEYGSVAPSQIRPVEMSQGHFSMIQMSQGQFPRITGINAEMMGEGSQKTVSGRAIKARQQGGSVILKPRLFNFDEAQLDCTYMLLSRIQQYYSPAKLRRIIGLSELSRTGEPGAQSVFSDPVTGAPMTDEDIFKMLTNLGNTKFDLAMKQVAADPTERQASYERAIQLVAMMVQSGRPIGLQTFAALVEMSDMPSRLEQGLRLDMAQPPMMPPEAGGAGQVMNSIRQASGGHSDSGGPGPGNV